MNIISIQSLAKSHGIKKLIENATFGIDDRDRIGVIGVNGCGKSTLLRMLTRDEEPDAGILTMRQDLRIGWLPQNPIFDPQHTVLEHVFSPTGNPGQERIARVTKEYELACRRLALHPEDASHLTQVEALSHEMDAAGAWEYESRAKTILGKLGVEDFEAKMGELSGGYRKRVALAHALLEESDLLVLDEPTNHLDVDMVAWLEGYLERYNGAVVLVTHDRYFLDRVTRRIFEIDRGDLRIFDGNFSYYLEKKAEVEASFSASEDRRRSILRMELAWLQRGARARTTKQKARIQRAEALQEQSFERSRDELEFKTQTRRMGKKILEMEGVGKSFEGCTILHDFSYIFTRGERLGIVGPNGIGKTTLIRLMTGEITPDSGKVEVGETIHFATFAQEYGMMDPNERAIDYVKREGGEVLRAPDGTHMSAALVMERFLFTPQMLYAPIEKLSGGERRRLYLVRTLMCDPNFLVLDEPTNDLDIPTLQALEDFLTGFGGCLVVISHDRYFLDRTVERVVAFEGEGRTRLYPGNYSVYAEIRDEEEDREKKAKSEQKKDMPAALKQAVKPTKLTWKEQRELETLEERIPVLEERQKAIEQEMVTSATDFTRLRQLTDEQAALAKELATALERWEDLATRAEESGN